MSKKAIGFILDYGACGDFYGTSIEHGTVYYDDDTNEVIKISYHVPGWNRESSIKHKRKLRLQNALHQQYGGEWGWTASDKLEPTY